MTAPPPRRLVVLRHAKSAWPDVPDRERPLAGRGRRDGPAAGRWLRDAGHLPDSVICSPARRTRQTWDLVAEELGSAPTAAFDERVYEAGPRDLLAVVRDVAARVQTLLLIGHCPGVQALTLALAGEADDDALDRARAAFPTSAIAVLSFRGRWSDLVAGAARLTDFAVPRGRKP